MTIDGLVAADYQVPTANAGVGAVTLGPDGNIWFTETQARKFGPYIPDTNDGMPIQPGQQPEQPLSNSSHDGQARRAVDGAFGETSTAWLSTGIAPATVMPTGSVAHVLAMLAVSSGDVGQPVAIDLSVF